MRVTVARGATSVNRDHWRCQLHTTIGRLAARKTFPVLRRWPNSRDVCGLVPTLHLSYLTLRRSLHARYEHSVPPGGALSSLECSVALVLRTLCCNFKLGAPCEPRVVVGGRF